MRLLKILLILVTVAFPLGELLRIDLGNNITLRPLDIIVGTTSVVFWIIVIKQREVPKFYFKPVTIFWVICALSLFINFPSFTSSQVTIASFYLLRWVSYSSILLMITNLDMHFKKSISPFLVFDGFIILFLGYVQYFLYPNLRNLYYLGWDEHNYRLFSVFLDPNFAGAFFVLFFIYILSWLHDSLRKKRTRLTLIFAFVELLDLLAVFLTYSRSALIMLIVGLATFYIFVDSKKYLYYFLTAALIIFLSLSGTFNKENTNPFRITSSIARVISSENALRIVYDHPVFGVGFNTYRYVQQQYGFRNSVTKYPAHADAGVDNSFLFVLATTGVVGFLGYSFLWFKILKKAASNIDDDTRFSSAVIIASSVSLFVDSLFINSLFFPAIMLWMWIVIGTG